MRTTLFRSSVPRAAASLVAICTVSLSACAPDTPPPAAESSDEVIYAQSPPSWFEAWFTSLRVARDGSSLLFQGDLLDPSGASVSFPEFLDVVFAAAYDDQSRLIVAGRIGDEAAWYRAAEAGGAPVPLDSVDVADLPTWSPSGQWIAQVRRTGRDNTVRVAAPGGAKTVFTLPGPVRTAAWVPGDTTLLVLLTEQAGLTSLHALDRRSGETHTIAEGLDGPSSPPNLAVSPDGRFAFLALASAGTPDPEVRQDPDADRDLDIYRIDLATGERQVVVQTPAEELAPAIGDGALYWISIETRMAAVVVATAGGPVSVGASDVQIPTWRPDGRALGVTTGGWRLADWAVNLDGGVIELDADLRAAGALTPIITGNHEDFSPVWSPDGRWIAYHSHRSATPATGYDVEDGADDIFLRRPDAPTTDEIRLTDFGWEVGMPDWAPDGSRLVMDSWNPPGADERTSVWIVEIEPETGTMVGRTRVPLPPQAAGSPSMQAWSPVREELAVTFAAPNVSPDIELWIVSPDGTAARRVTTYPAHGYGGVDWSADGEELIYPAIVEGVQQLFAIGREGGEPRQITRDSMSLFHPQVSPDGRWVAASRIRTVKRILRRPLDGH